MKVLGEQFVMMTLPMMLQQSFVGCRGMVEAYSPNLIVRKVSLFKQEHGWMMFSVRELKNTSMIVSMQVGESITVESVKMWVSDATGLGKKNHPRTKLFIGRQCLDRFL